MLGIFSNARVALVLALAVGGVFDMSGVCRREESAFIKAVRQFN